MRWIVVLLLGTGLLAGGCRTPPRLESAPMLVRFFLERPEGSATVATLPRSGVRIALAPKPVLTEYDVVNVELAEVELGRCLLFQVTPAAARDLYRLTASQQGRRLVLTLNGTALGARRIEGPWDEGRVLVFVEVPDEALPALVRDLKRMAVERQSERARRA